MLYLLLIGIITIGIYAFRVPLKAKWEAFVATVEADVKAAEQGDKLGPPSAPTSPSPAETAAMAAVLEQASKPHDEPPAP